MMVVILVRTLVPWKANHGQTPDRLQLVSRLQTMVGMIELLLLKSLSRLWAPLRATGLMSLQAK